MTTTLRANPKELTNRIRKNPSTAHAGTDLPCPNIPMKLHINHTTGLLDLNTHHSTQGHRFIMIPLCHKIKTGASLLCHILLNSNPYFRISFNLIHGVSTCGSFLLNCNCLRLCMVQGDMDIPSKISRYVLDRTVLYSINSNRTLPIS